jgi:hypothetical protein
VRRLITGHPYDDINCVFCSVAPQHLDFRGSGKLVASRFVIFTRAVSQAVATAGLSPGFIQDLANCDPFDAIGAI